MILTQNLDNEERVDIEIEFLDGTIKQYVNVIVWQYEMPYDGYMLFISGDYTQTISVNTRQARVIKTKKIDKEETKSE